MSTKPSSIHRDVVAQVAEAIDNALVATVHLMDTEEYNLDTIVVSLGEARAYVVKAQIMAQVADVIESVTIDVPHDQPRVYGDEVDLSPRYPGDRPKLPKLKPQGHTKDKPKYKPGITKMFKGAKQFDCPTCGAEANTNCFKYEGPGAHPKRTDERNDGSFHHRKRQDLAFVYNNKVRKANILN